MTPRLSVLDQSPIGEGMSAADALEATVRLAEEADALGATRFWVAEHHFSPSFAGSAPEVLAAVLLARTRHLRIGSGGVLLPRYDPTKVAEVFRVLAGLFPGRVDLGVGRAGGPAERFPQQVVELLDGLTAGPLMPSGVVPPEVWLLGGGTSSAALAAELGTEFCFAHFLNPAPGVVALDTYRRGPHTRLGALAVRVVVAEDESRANALARGLLLWRSRKDLGDDRPLPSAETVRGHRWTSAEMERAEVNSRSLIAGTPEQVRAALARLADAHGVEELVVNTPTHDPADRVRSYRLLADVLGVRPPGAALAEAGRTA
ncbi:MsnO8 family LLM class oxidoreductase [Umezawaea sp. Da 62-37]|uniref:MsnO8 family LLM class oxidoreductase n=1 Tax=Umezawaea sp. Da 62-37 TaxID=3075927 RepID=UPI0028F74958|nr:MsnO8 family LLM class oxidoreductase [Umezawaea sp. Da 62-37]WNV84619.1 MsnO8 family LLM class oxidoreductase [Umezawaea sp. Da 62-37]